MLLCSSGRVNSLPPVEAATRNRREMDPEIDLMGSGTDAGVGQLRQQFLHCACAVKGSNRKKPLHKAQHLKHLAFSTPQCYMQR